MKPIQTLLGTTLLFSAVAFGVIYAPPPKDDTFSKAEIGHAVKPPRTVYAAQHNTFPAVSFPADVDTRLAAFLPIDMKGEITAIERDNKYIAVKVEYQLVFDHNDKNNCDNAKRLIQAGYTTKGSEIQRLTLNGCEQSPSNAALKNPVTMTVTQIMNDASLMALSTSF